MTSIVERLSHDIVEVLWFEREDDERAAAVASFKKNHVRGAFVEPWNVRFSWFSGPGRRSASWTFTPGRPVQLPPKLLREIGVDGWLLLEQSLPLAFPRLYPRKNPARVRTRKNPSRSRRNPKDVRRLIMRQHGRSDTPRMTVLEAIEHGLPLSVAQMMAIDAASRVGWDFHVVAQEWFGEIKWYVYAGRSGGASIDAMDALEAVGFRRAPYSYRSFVLGLAQDGAVL
jgi:hypothetical protein